MTKKLFDAWVNNQIENLSVSKATNEGEEAKTSREKGKESLRKALAGLEKDLYGESGTGGVDECEVPLGSRLLWEVVPMRRKALFGPDENRQEEDSMASKSRGKGPTSRKRKNASR